MKLHEAIIVVLKENNNRLSTKEIADKINERGLYTKKDCSDVKPSQIFLRCRSPTYRRLFNEVSKDEISL